MILICLKSRETYAVENAREEVKQCALHICGNFGKNGVLKSIAKNIEVC